MREGVENSEIFLAIITEQYFTREFCIMELRWAREAGKPIQPVIRAEDKQRIGEFLDMAPTDLKVRPLVSPFVSLPAGFRRGKIDYGCFPQLGSVAVVGAAYHRLIKNITRFTFPETNSGPREDKLHPPRSRGH